MKTLTSTPSLRRHWLATDLGFVIPAILLTCLTFASPVRADDEPYQHRRVPELPSPLCDSVNVPLGNRVSSHLYASGIQIYRWSGTNWVFIAPEATLFADPCYDHAVGIHYAGPTWEAQDGYIQRINTVGGTAPATAGAFVGDEARVPYTAEYYFYRATKH